jgi:hypothetical protein
MDPLDFKTDGGVYEEYGLFCYSFMQFGENPMFLLNLLPQFSGSKQ